jgi:hypothetical protein
LGKVMTAQRSRKSKKSGAQPDKETTVAVEQTKVKRSSTKSDEALAKVQEALKAAQAKVKHERQARAKAERALAEAQETLAAARLKTEQELQTRIRRVSFIVRLIVDEHGQPRRTEIEQVEGSRKQSFLGLDGERLVAFIKGYISPTIISELTIPPVPSAEKAKAPMSGPLRSKSNLTVSEVRVFRLGDPDFMTLVLTGEEPFGLMTRFQLQGPDAQFLITHASSFEIKLYTNEVASGKSKLLTTYSAKLVQDVLEYTASVEAPGLRPGLYRLFTVVILGAPVKLAGFYGKTIINVT